MTNKPLTDESMSLAANEELMSSKAFILFVVKADGSLANLGNTTHLNPAENYGLSAFIYDQIEPPMNHEEFGDE